MSRRVAIVGTGVAGLVAARGLNRAGFDITVFEADSRPGGHSHTVEVETQSGPIGVDTGFIVLNDRNYPTFERLLGELGVATKRAPMSFSVADQRGDFEWSMTPGGLFAKHSHLFDPRFHRMLADLLRFFREARELVEADDEDDSLMSFLERGGYSDYFIERMIVPQVSAVWSADPGALDAFPASFLAEFLSNHGALQITGRPRWRSIVGGSRRYVEALTASFADRIRLNSPVREIRRLGAGVVVGWDGGADLFDDVVIAAHSDQALAMLADPSEAEREVLGAIPYRRNEVVLHTDVSLMPRRKRAWASWNFHLMDEPTGRTTVTYDMTRLQRLPTDQRLLVTLNRTEAIDPRRIVHEMTYSHPVFTRESLVAQRRWSEISGAMHTHYCGAYWGWGFHEDGAVSGMRVVDSLESFEPAHQLEEVAA